VLESGVYGLSRIRARHLITHPARKSGCSALQGSIQSGKS
jgi:hypothetical protein